MFHLASITDTTLQDQKIQTHDNVEGFRRLLEYLRPEKTPIVYATSAATYGIRAGVNRVGIRWLPPIRMRSPKCSWKIWHEKF